MNIKLNGRHFLCALAAISVAACATPYTGPVEVTRFTAADQRRITPDTIVIDLDSDDRVTGKAAYQQAVREELQSLGYVFGPPAYPSTKPGSGSNRAGWMEEAHAARSVSV